MKKSLFLLTIILMIFRAFCVLISAMDPAGSSGTALYHQDFAKITRLEGSGVTMGTLSSDTAAISCENESLSVKTPDGRRVYLLLPSAEKTDSYTLEFTFRFTETPKENGYIAAILTCRGDEPTNITDLVIRADGTVDDFSAPDEKLREAVSSGKTIAVKIPVEGGVLHRITLAADDEEWSLERDSVLVISSGAMGFAVRNSGVEIAEVYLVNGIGYTEKSGAFAVESFASDEAAAFEREPETEEIGEEPGISHGESLEESPEESPATGISFGIKEAFAWCFLSAGTAAWLYRAKRREI